MLQQIELKSMKLFSLQGTQCKICGDWGEDHSLCCCCRNCPRGSVAALEASLVVLSGAIAGICAEMNEIIIALTCATINVVSKGHFKWGSNHLLWYIKRVATVWDGIGKKQKEEVIQEESKAIQLSLCPCQLYKAVEKHRFSMGRAEARYILQILSMRKLILSWLALLSLSRNLLASLL